MTCTYTLDDADRYLLAYDPELAGKTESYLINKRIREDHFCGASLIEDVTETDQEPDQEQPSDSEAFFVFVEKLNWLDQEVKILILEVSQGSSLAEIGMELGGISRQAVYKKLKKSRSLIKHVLDLWAGRDDPQVIPEPGPAIPCFVDRNHQLDFDFGGVQ